MSRNRFFHKTPRVLPKKVTAQKEGSEAACRKTFLLQNGIHSISTTLNSLRFSLCRTFAGSRWNGNPWKWWCLLVLLLLLPPHQHYCLGCFKTSCLSKRSPVASTCLIGNLNRLYAIRNYCRNQFFKCPNRQLC